MQHSGNKRYFVIITIFLILIIGILIALLSRGGREDVATNPVLPVPVGVGTTQSVVPLEENNETNDQLYINTKFGQPVAVPNFLGSPTVEKYDDTVYLIAEEMGPEGQPLYQVFFYRGGSLGISLLSTDVAFSRARAEQAVVDLLDMSTIELCALQISQTVPAFVSQQTGIDYSGVELGMSMCPGAVDLGEF